MEQDIILKKNLFGGFDRKEVMEYINKLQNDCSSKQTKEELIDVRSQIAELTCILEERNAKVQSLKETVISLNSSLAERNNSTPHKFTCSPEEINAAKNMAQSISDILNCISNPEDKDISALFNRLSVINEEVDKISKTVCE